MSNENWTPGPWGDDYGTVLTENNDIVADNLTLEDATLIAAAPELYEALKDIAYAYRETFGLDGAYDPALRAAEYALAKARGENQ